MPDAPEAIRLESVTKRFDGHVAVEDVSLRIATGRIFGLLGPNGAGKTTTIRMIMNIILPDEGSIYVLGKPNDPSLSRRIGYLPEERGLYKRMKVLDHLVFLGEIRGLDRKTAKTRALEWMERLEIGSWARKKIEDCLVF